MTPSPQFPVPPEAPLRVAAHQAELPEVRCLLLELLRQVQDLRSSCAACPMSGQSAYRVPRSAG